MNAVSIPFTLWSSLDATTILPIATIAFKPNISKTNAIAAPPYMFLWKTKKGTAEHAI